uniref:Uncharacterized protein n=1 Tax=Anguilla anguilla TaxID=7936 RepID=A0A0E9PYM3_ANGAN
MTWITTGSEYIKMTKQSTEVQLYYCFQT